MTDIGLGHTVSREDLRWQTWPAAAAERELHPQERPARRHQAARRLDRARAVLRRRADPRSQADQGQAAPATWPRSCRPACARSRPKSRRRPAPAASSCRTITSTSSCRAATSEAEKAAGVEVHTSEIILSQRARAGDRPDGRGEERPARRRRQDRDARTHAAPGRDARAVAPDGHALARAAQPRRLRAGQAATADDDGSRRGGINMVRFGVTTTATPK